MLLRSVLGEFTLTRLPFQVFSSRITAEDYSNVIVEKSDALANPSVVDHLLSIICFVGTIAVSLAEAQQAGSKGATLQGRVTLDGDVPSARKITISKDPEICNAHGTTIRDVVIENDDVLIQTGGFIAVNQDDNSFSKLHEQGHIRVGSGKMEGVAIVTGAVRKGVLWTNALIPGAPANRLVHRVPDPITNRYRFKLGKGKIRKTGESPYKRDLTRMSFAPRTSFKA